MVVFISAFKNKVLGIDILHALGLHEGRFGQRDGIIGAVILRHLYPYLIHVAYIQRRGIDLEIQLLITAVVFDIGICSHLGIDLHQRFDHAERHFRHFIIGIAAAAQISNPYPPSPKIIPKNISMNAKNQPDMSYSKYPGTVPKKSVKG